MENLVIVESPTKARTLARFLGDKYTIEASMGHIRDLPKSELGVDIEHNFEPLYIIPRDKRKKVNELKKLAEGAKELWLATDPDREGEAIAWHLDHIIGEDKKAHPKVKRVEFHEITPEAIKEAFEHPREIDRRLVDAQQARRVLDRVVGYKLSPLLWKKIKRGLSAGRVQSIALRLIVEREREIDAFKAVEYWSIDAELEAGKGVFTAGVVSLDGKELEVHNQGEADAHVKALEKASYRIESITQKEVRRSPAAPFTTSTLQQTAGNKLRMSAKKTMMLSQNLYEQGYITYMRTDSVNLAPSAVTQTRDYIKSEFGEAYLPQSVRVYKAKVKNAQEAHEAIRPTNIKLTPNELKTKEGMTRDHLRVYELIWKRMLACQMNEAVFDSTSVDVTADPSSSTQDRLYRLRATGSTIRFDGWLRVYGVTEELEDDEEPSKKQVLPELKDGEDLDLKQLLPEQHFTQPPPRYTEASLIKKLEELGIGRPSTYAPILSTIQERYYVEREERRFKPSALGLAVNDFLLKYFPETFDYSFTASMEDKLDDVSNGSEKWQEVLTEFYGPFEKLLSKTEDKAEKVKLEVEKVDKKCPVCGKDLMIRFGRFGKFLACSGFPDCKHTESLEEKVGIKCPECGGDVILKKGRRGRAFYGCSNYPNCKFASWTKPKVGKDGVAVVGESGKEEKGEESEESDETQASES